MLTFLFTVLIIYLGIKLIAWASGYYMRRKWNRMMDEMRRQAYGFSGNGPQGPGQRPQQPQQPQRRKHFSREDGEYVAFEEIVVDSKTTATYSYDNASTTVETEERIVDAEWEDIRQ